MPILRKSVLILVTPLFSFLLFALAFDTGLVRVVSHPATVKKIVADSGVYNDFIPNVLKQAGSVSAQGVSVPLTDSSVQSAAQKTFTPQYLQNTTNTIIDSIYSWLDGKTAVPDFKINLSNQKAQFANQVAQAAGAKAASLPRCTQLSTASSYDVFSATCLPYGVTVPDVENNTLTTVLSGQGFLEKPVITANNLKSSGSSQSVFTNQLKNAPSAYRHLKSSPLILAVLAVLAGVAIVFLYPDRLRGLRHLGIALLVVGLLMLAFAQGVNEGVKNQLPKLKIDNAAFQTDIRTLITDVSQSIDKNFWFFGGLYTVLGVVGIGSSLYWHRRSEPEPVAEKPTPKKPSKT